MIAGPVPALIGKNVTTGKFKWVRPERLFILAGDKSGDNSEIPDFDKNLLAFEFQQSKELETADDTVRRLFTLGFLPKRYLKKYYEEQLISLVRRHQYDEESIEARIARMTAEIRYLKMLWREKGGLGTHCIKLIWERKHCLEQLRSWDYPRYEWILEKLDLTYKPEPTEEYCFSAGRKDALQRLTDKHCEEFRDERLAEYREQLEAQQVEFLADKVEKLIFIRDEQLDLNIEVTITQEDIETARTQYEEVKQKRDEVLKTRDTSDKWKMY